MTAVQARPVPYRWVVFCLLATGYLLVYFHRLALSVVAVEMMKDLAAGPALLGLLGSAYFYPYALMQIPAGLLSDSWGPRRTITVFFLLAGVASILFGLAPSAFWAIVARTFVGLGVATMFVPTMKVLTHWFKRDDFSIMAGILMAVGGLGVLCAAYPMAYLSTLLGWRGSFMTIGAATLVLGTVIWFLVRNTPEEKGYPPVETFKKATTHKTETIRLSQGMRMVLAKSSFWPLAIWFFFTCGIFFSFGGLWGGPYLQHVYHMSKAEAGKVLNMLAVAMVLGSPLLSYVSDRIFHSRKKMIVGCAVLMVGLTAILAFFPEGMTKPMLYIFCILLSLGSSAIVVIAFTSCKELFPVEIAGTSVGLINFFPFIGGAVTMPLLGLLLKNFGNGPYSPEAYGQAFMLYLIWSVLALAASLFTEDTIKK